MATVKKQGSGYKITVSMGYDIHGKQIRQHMTWTPSPGMTPKQVEKELKRQEVLFEETCKSRQITGGSLKLADFAQLWFRDYAETQLKPRTVANYHFLLRRVNDGLGHIRLDRLQPRQLLSFYRNLAEDDVRLDTKYTLRADLKQLLKERGITQAKLSHTAGLSLNTVESAIGGNNISASSAEKICQALGLPLTDLFDRVKRMDYPARRCYTIIAFSPPCWRQQSNGSTSPRTPAPVSSRPAPLKQRPRIWTKPKLSS